MVHYQICILLLIILNVIAFFIALVLTKKLRGSNFIRAGFFTPNLIGGIVLGYLWQTLFSQVFPYLGSKFGWVILKNPGWVILTKPSGR